MISLLMAGALLVPADTVTLSLAQALSTASDASPSVQAARLRTESAQYRASQAGNWGNPTLQATAENLGQAAAITGQPGLRGTEGQLLLSYLIPLGGDRAARIAAARGDTELRNAEERELTRRTQEALVAVAAQAHRDRELAALSREEAEGLDQLSRSLAERAAAGGVSEGEAARASLAAVSAWSRHATLEGDAAWSTGELARLLGQEPGTEVQVQLPACAGAPAAGTTPTPALEALEAQVEIADARFHAARAAAIPDIRPQMGLRRSAGVSALYVGLEVPLPLFDRQSSARTAAQIEHAAAEADLESGRRTERADRVSARTALERLEAVGARFNEAWEQALEQTVISAEARYRLGEGTLTALLDGRSARYSALADRLRWEAERWALRARWLRASGNPMSSEGLCGTRP